MSGTLFRAGGYDGDGPGPLYLRLARAIDEAIEAGALKPGEGLPPERELAALTGLSRVTARKAVATLVQAGRLARRRGSGTFIAPRGGRWSGRRRCSPPSPRTWRGAARRSARSG